MLKTSYVYELLWSNMWLVGDVFFLPVSSDIEDLCEPVNVLPSNGLNDTLVLLEQLKRAEHRARLAEAALARAQDDLQKMK